MYGYIYVITNLINGKQYIGKHKSSQFDPKYKGSGRRLNLAYKKYGEENFKQEVLFPCFSEEELNAEEAFLIDFFDCVASDHFYNEFPGGHGGFPAGEFSPNYGKKQSAETIAKRAEKLKGRTFSEESRAKISASLTGVKHTPGRAKKAADARRGKPSNFKDHHMSEDSRKKMSESLSGSNHPLYGKFGPDNPNYGKSRTAEQRAKISAGKLGKKRVYRPDGTFKLVYPSEIENYLNQGYVLHKIELRVS